MSAISLHITQSSCVFVKRDSGEIAWRDLDLWNAIWTDEKYGCVLHIARERTDRIAGITYN